MSGSSSHLHQKLRRARQTAARWCFLGLHSRVEASSYLNLRPFNLGIVEHFYIVRFGRVSVGRPLHPAASSHAILRLVVVHVGHVVSIKLMKPKKLRPFVFFSMALSNKSICVFAGGMNFTEKVLNPSPALGEGL